MSAFMQGLQTGSQTARGWIDTYEAARKRREEADLKSRREGILTAQPEYSQGYTAEQGQQLEAMASAINPETGRPYYNVQAGQGGNYNVTPDFTEAQTPRMGMGADSQYGVAPVELQTTGLGRAGVVAQPIPFNQQRVANFLGGRVEGDLAPERMELMRSRALANTIADPMERQRALIQMDENERAARRGAQAEELTGLQINRERKTVTREQKNREATQALSQQLSSGNPPDVTQIYKLASDFGVDPAPLVKLAADNMGLTEEIAKAATEKLVKQINAASTSPDKFRTLLDTVADPDPLDNIKPELRETKNGYRVFYGDRAISPEFKETKDMTALQQLAGFYRDTVAGKPYETAITMATLDAKRAAIEESRAGTKLKTAQAANVGQDKLSPLEKNLATLKRLGVSVSPEEVKSMAGLKTPTLSPEAAAQIDIITASLKDNSTPANIEAARIAVADIFRGEGLKQRNTTIVNGLRTAAGRNDLPSAVKQLQNAGVANETIVGLARQAGVAIPPELLPPAPTPQTGLDTNAPRQPIQLLAPFNAVGDLRRRMIEEQRGAGSSGGLVNPAGF